MKGVESVSVADVARHSAEAIQRHGEHSASVDHESGERRHPADQDAAAAASFLAILQGALVPVALPAASAANRSGDLTPPVRLDRWPSVRDVPAGGPARRAARRVGATEAVDESAKSDPSSAQSASNAPTTEGDQIDHIDVQPSGEAPLPAPESDVAASPGEPPRPDRPVGDAAPPSPAFLNRVFDIVPTVALAESHGRTGAIPSARSMEDSDAESPPGAPVGRDQHLAPDSRNPTRLDVAASATEPSTGNVGAGSRLPHPVARDDEKGDAGVIVVSNRSPRQHFVEMSNGMASTAEVGKPWRMPPFAARSGEAGHDDAAASSDSAAADRSSTANAPVPGLSPAASTEPSSGLATAPSGVLANVPAQVVRLLNQQPTNGTAVVMRLDPPTLGSVVLRIVSVDGQRVRVHFRVDDPVVRDTLADQWHQLETALVARGLVPDGFSVDLGSIQTTMDSSGQTGSNAARSGNGPGPVASSIAARSAREDQTVESAPSGRDHGGRYIDCRL